MRELKTNRGERNSLNILVKNATLPGKFKMPQLDSYSGRSNLVVHMKNFQNLMLVLGVPDKIMCKVFPTTLSGLARTWNKTLAAGSIRDITTFPGKFVHHFQGARLPIKDPSSL